MYRMTLAILVTLSSVAFAMNDPAEFADTCDLCQTIFMVADPQPEYVEPLGFTNPDSVSICSAAYLGNDTYVTAGHCVVGMQNFRISHHAVAAELHQLDADPQLELVPTTPMWPAVCVAHPGGDWDFDKNLFVGVDIAWCKRYDPGTMAEPAWFQDLPDIPVMIPEGCETDYFEEQFFCEASPEILYTYSGTGRTTPGQRRYEEIEGSEDSGVIEYLYYANGGATFFVSSFGDESTWLAGGDSGGPMNVQMPDGTWRILGVLSKLGTIIQYRPPSEGGEFDCNDCALHTPVPSYLWWLETSSGEDLTPCHDRVAGHFVHNGDSTCDDDYDLDPVVTSAPGPTCHNGEEGGAGDGCGGWFPIGEMCGGGFAPPPDEEEFFDEVLVGGSQPPLPPKEPIRTELYGTAGADQIDVGNVGGKVWAGAGSDTVLGGPRSDYVRGGAGGDTLSGGGGGDILIPERGADLVYGGEGDDIVIIHGECELEVGGLLDGGPGQDILYAPVSVAEIQKLGIPVSGFEEVRRVDPGFADAWCGSVEGGLQITTVDLAPEPIR